MMKLAQKERDMMKLAQAMYEEEGYRLIPLRGKVPTDRGWAKETATKVVGDSNYGVVLSAQDLVIDADPRSYLPGDDPLQRLLSDCGLATIHDKTLVVATGGGGYHIYLRKPATARVKETQQAYKGLEFKTKGRQVVGIGSIHPETKEKYVSLATRVGEFLDAPKVLLELLSRLEPAAGKNKRG